MRYPYSETRPSVCRLCACPAGRERPVSGPDVAGRRERAHQRNKTRSNVDRAGDRISVGTRIPTGVVLVAGLVLLVALPGQWIVAGLLITITGVIRIYDLRRGRLRFAPWPLAIIALLMPRPVAHSYLEEFGHHNNEIPGWERRRHVRNAIVASPGTLVTVWHDWLRAKMVKLTVRALSSRVHQAELLVQDMTAGARQYRVALRRLRRYCRLILCATGSGRFHEYAGPACALLLSCRQSAENGGGAELAERIRQEVRMLACALTSWRPDHA